MLKSCFRLFLAVSVVVMCSILHVSAATPDEPQQQQQSQAAAAANDAPDEKLALSDQVIQDVLEPFRSGIETQNIKQILSVFDKREMSGYDDLQQQLRAFFRQYEQVNFRYQILQATSDKDHASATAEIDMDAMPYSMTEIPTRRSVQMRFQLKQEDKGWRVLAFSPANFFSLDRTEQGR